MKKSSTVDQGEKKLSRDQPIEKELEEAQQALLDALPAITKLLRQK